MITIQKLTAEKSACIARIKRKVEPWLWESGYVTGPIGAGRRYKVWVEYHPKTEARLTWRLHGLAIDLIEGIAEDGVIVDGHAGGLVTTPFVALALEDLLRVERWVVRQFGA